MAGRRLLLVISTLALLALIACGREAPLANNEGNEAFSNEDLDAALQAYERAQEQEPDLAEPYYNTGNTHYRQGAYEEAQTSYERALLHAGEELTRSGRFNMGNTFFDAQQYEKAVDAYKEVLWLDPDDMDAKHNLELALQRLQDQQQQSQEQAEQGQQEQDQGQGEDTPQAADQRPQQQDADPQPDARPRPQQASPLTEEQARQLLESIGENTKTLQERLQQTYVVQGSLPAQDW